MKATWMWVAIGGALCLAACSEGSAPIANDAEAAASLEASVQDVAADEAATPYVRATRALADNRMLAPVGDNAVEYFLAARAQATDQARARVALAELQPYVLIAAEQAIARADAQEAQRLLALIERIDAGAPALPRLRTEVAALMRGQAARAAAAIADTAAASPAVSIAEVAPRTAAPSPSPVAALEEAPVPAVAPPPAVAVQEDARPIAPPPAAAPRVAQGERAPRLLQDAPPRYPLPALRARIEGQAEVAFTIQPDGSVRDVRLVSSTADGMFDASALAVAQRWRFEATGRAHVSSRTVRFRLPAGEARGG